ncbi:hypothetical protein EY643_14785 [Halioglobus maricola]|uniref:Uncharacterized protein n=1 Tax=Halioglobus maricola TaxID=2601894 RepID=A0A5P9NM30_9GAMM|nr:cytochrome c3 family protein [Halioglobus maricola]QFU76812.1 hypothetical protein EY643_14785 [Halioglobus maricola]
MKIFVTICLLLLPALAMAATDNVDPATASAIQVCLDCHDYGDDAPVHQVLQGSHGIEGDPEDIAGRRACLDCHGESEAHIAAPKKMAPDRSFGPRWPSEAGEQDRPCLDCHEDNTAENWRNALHMVNGLTCVTCHDIHAEVDPVLSHQDQQKVCTDCHESLKEGIHELGGMGDTDPPCSACHNPHDHEQAEPRMRANQSAGCVFCHNGEEMEAIGAFNSKAAKYHGVLGRSERSCIDCHQSIPHAPLPADPDE